MTSHRILVCIPYIEVGFEIDSNGILKVGTVENGIDKSKSIRITSSKDRLSEPEIARMVKMTEGFAAGDETILFDVYGVRTTVSVASSTLRALPSCSPFFSAEISAKNHPPQSSER